MDVSKARPEVASRVGLKIGLLRSRRIGPARLSISRSLRRVLSFILPTIASAAGAGAQDFSVYDAPSSALVRLRRIDPSIPRDIRYAGSNNFTGRPVPGYAAPEYLFLHDVADALSRVQAELRQHRLSLKVYDCYRPRRAVRAFRAWVQDPETDPLLKRFHP